VKYFVENFNFVVSGSIWVPWVYVYVRCLDV
jgi:hypothetical protein